MIRRTLDITIVKIATLTLNNEGEAIATNNELIIKGKNLSMRTINSRLKRNGYTDCKIMSIEEATKTFEMPVQVFVKNATEVETTETDIVDEVSEDDTDLDENLE